MNRPRFTIRDLFLLVGAVAVGTAALLNANEWWVSLLWAAVLLLLVLAGFVAFFRREAQRAFWSGYLVAGSLYLLLLLYSIPQFSQTTSWTPYGPLHMSQLMTTKILVWAYSLLPATKTTPDLPPPLVSNKGGRPTMDSSLPGMPGGMGGMSVRLPPNPDYVDSELFTQVGQALWMLFFSWLGGTTARRLYRTRSPPESAASV